MAKQDDWVRLTVRLPPDVYARLNEIVAAGPNSMNAEIVARLEASLEGRSNNELNLSHGQRQFFELMQEDIRHAMRSALDRWHLYEKTFPDDGPHKYFDEDEKK